MYSNLLASAASDPKVNITISNDSAVLHPMMWMFIAILVTFLATRTITRVIRSGAVVGLRNVSVGSTHVHHQVFGILIMIGTGIVLLSATPEGRALNIAGAMFGVGVSLTLDEFALWLHLRDVYWTSEGRKSVDAVFCVLVITGVLIGGADFVTGGIGTSGWWASIGGLAFLLALSVISLLKGKVVTGVIGIAFWPVALVGAIRLANPDSWWAHRWYSEGSRRGRRAHKRFSVRREERWNRLRDLIAGAPQIAAGKLAGAQNARPDDHADAPDPPSPEPLPEQDLAESVSVDRAKAGPSGVRGPKG